MTVRDNVVAIARVEFLRSVRTLGEETNKLLGIAVSGLMLVGFALAGAAVLFFFGGGVLSYAGDNPRVARAAFSGFWTFVAGFTAFRTVSVVGEVDGAPGMLTTTSPQAVAAGLLLAESARHAAYLLLPAVVLAVALSAGSGSVVAGPAFLLTGLLAWATAFSAGSLVGQSIRYLSRAVPIVRRNRLLLGGAAMVGYMVVIVQFGDLVLVLSDTPVGWYGDLALVAATDGGDVARAGVTVAASLAGGPLLALAYYRVAVTNWFGNPAATPAADDAGTAGSTLQQVGRRLERVVSRPTAAVVRAVWLRGRRSPFKLTYAAVPAFAFVGYIAPVVQEGRLPGSLPVMLAGYAAWAVGAAFTLNPLGDEGPLLPVTVSSGISGSAFVRGRLLAAWLLGVVPTAVLVVAAGAAMWKSTVAILLAGTYAVVLTVAAPALSVGVGMAVPNFETQRVMVSHEAVVPSVVAFFGFLIVLGVVGAPGGLALLFFDGHGTGGGSLPTYRLAGLAVTALLGTLVAVPSYVYAVRRFERYEVDG
jgi:hypothetical protein